MGARTQSTVDPPSCEESSRVKRKLVNVRATETPSGERAVHEAGVALHESVGVQPELGQSLWQEVGCEDVGFGGEATHDGLPVCACEIDANGQFPSIVNLSPPRSHGVWGAGRA